MSVLLGNPLLLASRRELWTPAEINPYLWYDAADTATITLSTGVSQWTDKGSRGLDAAQATAAAQPAYVTGALNGLPVLRFDGGDDWLFTGINSDFGMANSHTWLSVAELSSATPAYPMIATINVLEHRTVNQTGRPSFVTGNSGAGEIAAAPNGTTRSLLNDPGVTVMSHDALATGAWSIWQDGSLRDSGTPGAPTFSGSPPFNIGARAGGSFFWPGDIAEIVVVLDLLSTDDRQKLEGYAAWKWGLQALLPGGHPYENSPPYL
ncbi:LamG domain-containing protein [Oceanibaculum indicum]|uniref:Uncharacterized protein n=1 Tax=Oceanibaculum indicum P24 TaxID=1207063 RepID=K2K045_9PROT|nr:hypothetical protein [Oceanibaculum indicum]EKE70900.1 hypothetical protein P24_15194 [Oceanibaculum indicum P24]